MPKCSLCSGGSCFCFWKIYLYTAGEHLPKEVKDISLWSVPLLVLWQYLNTIYVHFASVKFDVNSTHTRKLLFPPADKQLSSPQRKVQVEFNFCAQLRIFWWIKAKSSATQRCSLVWSVLITCRLLNASPNVNFDFSSFFQWEVVYVAQTEAFSALDSGCSSLLSKRKCWNEKWSFHLLKWSVIWCISNFYFHFQC